MKLTELQAKLGERMENLCRTDMSAEELAREIERSKAAASIGSQMVRNAAVMMNMKKGVGGLSNEFVNSFI